MATIKSDTWMSLRYVVALPGDRAAPLAHSLKQWRQIGVAATIMTMLLLLLLLLLLLVTPTLTTMTTPSPCAPAGASAKPSALFAAMCRWMPGRGGNIGAPAPTCCSRRHGAKTRMLATSTGTPACKRRVEDGVEVRCEWRW